MQLRRSHSAIIKSTHTYVSARVVYDEEEARSPKQTIYWAGSWCPIYEQALTWLPMAKRLTHLAAPHPLMIKHPLNLGRRCSLVWKPKKINRGPFPLDSDLSHHQQTRHLQSTDISEIPLAQPWPLKSTSLLDIFESNPPYGIEAYSYSSVLL